MEANLFEDVDAFYEMSTAALSHNLSENSLFLGILKQALRAKHRPHLMGCLTMKEEPIGFCLQTIPEQVVLAFSAPLKEEAANVFAQMLSAYSVTRFVGKKEPTQMITNALAALRSRKPVITMDQQLYSLDMSMFNPSYSGTLRKMTRMDIATVAEWIRAFDKEANLSEARQTLEEAYRSAQIQFEKSGLHLFIVDGECVAMANATRKIDKTVTINLVYTPEHLRRRGYASSCVSALCQQCREEGFTTILLYTDLANPTSNHIYQDIGFKKISKAVVIEVKKVE
ncbi:GNAT family N-acetyltransferase [Shouchella sp. 1P09AA]|uniref:GNAT family N-acetyltransferase n=1 Tax=unclassified Shouchella TaxID=2893065 RepID=UPI0039A275B3